jgi:folate-binding protein YgfZ
VINSQLETFFFPLDHLSVLEISGEDAGQFLQGQLTCNINELTTTKASFGAFCTAKGRVITTVLILKLSTTFQIILPSSLLDKVKNKLQLYVLRSKVQLYDRRSALQLIGLSCPHNVNELGLVDEHLALSQTPVTAIRLPTSGPRFVCLLPIESVFAFTESIQQRGFVYSSAEHWRYLDISSGIPWFELPESELYIPQMLNIDKLGGISFNKGCYTGQEIVARTHYLGQSKRELYIAEADTELTNAPEQLDVLDATASEKLGRVLIKQNYQGKSRLLLVLQTVDAQAKNFILDDADRTLLTPLLCQ